MHRALRVYEVRSGERCGWSGRILAPGWWPGLTGLVSHLDGVRAVLVAPRTENRGGQAVFNFVKHCSTAMTSLSRCGFVVSGFWRKMSRSRRGWCAQAELEDPGEELLEVNAGTELFGTG